MVDNKTVLIVAYYWPPAGGSGVQRWVYFAKGLSEMGWKVIVVTKDKPTLASLDKTLERLLPNDIEVYLVKSWEPHATANTFKKDAHTKSFLFSWIRANLFFPDARQYWIAPSVKKISEILKKHKVDVLVSSGPPHSAHLIAYKTLQNHPLPWLADFRDPWVDFFQNKRLPMIPFMRKKHQKWQDLILKTAQAVTVTAPTLKHQWDRLTNCELIPNGFEKKIIGDRSTRFELVYTGSLKAVQNPKALWLALEEILGSNQNFSEDFSMKLIGNFDAEIFKAVQQYNLQNWVKFVDYVPKEALDQFLTSAHLLLLVGVDMEETAGVVPAKLYEYWAAERPILGLVRKDSDVVSLVKETNSGKCFDFDDVEGVKKALLDWHCDFKAGNFNFEPKNMALYQRDQLSERMSKLLNKIIDQHGNR